MTRKDLSKGYQCVQPAHALAVFSSQYRETFEDWLKNGQNLVVLSTTNEKQLLKLVESLESNDLKYVVFREPDIGNHVTALAIEPSEVAYKLTSSLPLTLKE